MWSKELLKFAEKVYEQFENYPIDDIKADYDKIIFLLGRAQYQYDYKTETISRVTQFQGKKTLKKVKTP